jgi:hypothetical protein
MNKHFWIGVQKGCAQMISSPLYLAGYIFVFLICNLRDYRCWFITVPALVMYLMVYRQILLDTKEVEND